MLTTTKPRSRDFSAPQQAMPTFVLLGGRKLSKVIGCHADLNSGWSVQDGYTVRDQVLCDLLHVFDVTLRTYKPLQMAETQAQTPGEPCACEPEPPCSCASAARLKLSHLQADAQVRPP